MELLFYHDFCGSPGSPSYTLKVEPMGDPEEAPNINATCSVANTNLYAARCRDPNSVFNNPTIHYRYAAFPRFSTVNKIWLGLSFLPLFCRGK